MAGRAVGFDSLIRLLRSQQKRFLITFGFLDSLSNQNSSNDLARRAYLQCAAAREDLIAPGDCLTLRKVNTELPKVETSGTFRTRNSSIVSKPAKVKPSDIELIDNTLSGDQAAFGELVCRYQDRLYNMVTHTIGCAVEAEDVVQEAFVQAFTKLSSFRRDSAFYTWLYRIAINAAISRRRKKRPSISVEQHQEASGSEPMDDAEMPTERLEREESVAQVHTALDQLNEQHKAILVLREIEGFCYEEISEILDLPIGTVRSRLHRARSHLKEQLEPMLFEEPADRGN